MEWPFRKTENAPRRGDEAPNTATISIRGNDVKPGKDLLPGVPYADGLHTTLENASGAGVLEAWSRHTGQLIAPTAGVFAHGFLAAAQAAYAGHYPLILSPDHIWLLIAQGFALHVRENAEALRHRFVAHEGKVRLTVLRDDLIVGFAGNDWEGVLDDFCSGIADYIGETTQTALMPTFSTTGVVERAAFAVTLMDSFRHYFNYEALHVCGIPTFYLEGTAEDWRRLREHAAGLITEDCDLDWWRPHLLATLDQFVAAVEGKPDPVFWRDFYCYGGCFKGEPELCGEQRIKGNVINFFPYLEDNPGPPGTSEEGEYGLLFGVAGARRNPWLGRRVRRTPLNNTYHNGMRLINYAPDEFGLGEGLTRSILPSGLASAPFLWRTLNAAYDMQFVAGFVGATQDPQNLAVRPELGWAVCARA